MINLKICRIALESRLKRGEANVCDKKCFHSEKSALKFGRGRVIGMNNSSKSFNKSYRARRNGRVRAYWCNICKAYHITKTTKRKEILQ